MNAQVFWQRYWQRVADTYGRRADIAFNQGTAESLEKAARLYRRTRNALLLSTYFMQEVKKRMRELEQKG